MQSKTVDFAPVTLPGELDETVSSLMLAHSLYYLQTWLHPQNRKYVIYCLPSEEDRDTTTGNMYKNLVKFEQHVIFWDMWGDRRTGREQHRHTDTLIAMLRIPYIHTYIHKIFNKDNLAKRNCHKYSEQLKLGMT